MKIFNSSEKYGLVAKLFHWITFIALMAQVPFGFYLVGHQGFLFNYDLAILLYFQTLVVTPHFPHGLGVHLLFI